MFGWQQTIFQKYTKSVDTSKCFRQNTPYTIYSVVCWAEFWFLGMLSCSWLDSAAQDRTVCALDIEPLYFQHADTSIVDTVNSIICNACGEQKVFSSSGIEVHQAVGSTCFWGFDMLGCTFFRFLIRQIIFSSNDWSWNPWWSILALWPIGHTPAHPLNTVPVDQSSSRRALASIKKASG